MTLLTKGGKGQSTLRSIVHHFTWNLLENIMNRFLHIPYFAWISHALPLNIIEEGIIELGEEDIKNIIKSVDKIHAVMGNKML